MGGDYYNALKALARTVRERHDVSTSDLGIATMKRICKAEGITKIDLWKHKLRKVRAAYFVDGDDSFILLNANIKPVEPRLFSLAHELKHHLTDRDLAIESPLGCDTSAVTDSRPPIEIGAEVFAAEFIFPEAECRDWIYSQLGSRECTKEEVVRLKRSCPAKISYTFLVKRLEWFRLIKRGSFAGVQFRKLEEKLYGVPFYRRRYGARR